VARPNKAELAPQAFLARAAATAVLIVFILAMPCGVNAQTVGDSIRAGAPAGRSASEAGTIEDFDQGPDSIRVYGGVPGAASSPGGDSVSAPGSAPPVPTPPVEAASAPQAPPSEVVPQAAPSAAPQATPALANVPAAPPMPPSVVTEAAPSPSAGAPRVSEVRIDPGATSLPMPSQEPSPAPVASGPPPIPIESGVIPAGVPSVSAAAPAVVSSPVPQPAPSVAPAIPAVVAAPVPDPSAVPSPSWAPATEVAPASPVAAIPEAARTPAIAPVTAAPAVAAAAPMAAIPEAARTPATAPVTAVPAVAAAAPVAAIPEAATTSAIAPVTAVPAVAAAAPVAAMPEAPTTSAIAPVTAAPVADLPASSQSIDTKTASAKKSQGRPVVAAKEPTKVASNEPSQGAFAGLQFSSGSQPIDIKAEKMTFDQNGKSVLWQGHVHTINGQSQVTSDSLRVNYGENFHDVRELIADGNVRISQGTRWATGDHAVLDQTKHTVVLTGSPVVHDGEDQIAGSKITVHLDTNLSDVENARAVIYPHQSRSPADGTSSGRGNPIAPPAERSAQPPPSVQGSPTEDNTP